MKPGKHSKRFRIQFNQDWCSEGDILMSFQGRVKVIKVYRITWWKKLTWWLFDHYDIPYRIRWFQGVLVEPFKLKDNDTSENRG